MSNRQLQDWITSYLEYVYEDEPPTTFKKWTAISVIAAALQRKCFLNWGRITFYPNMYIVLVGPSGSRKGTAMGPGTRFLRKLGITLAAESITREALIQELKKCESLSNNTNDPKGTQIISHSSLTIFSEELTVFLGYNNNQLMSDLTDWYDCKEHWTYRTKHMGCEEINGVWVNLIGATTPELLQLSMSRAAIGGGLTSRIVFVYEEKKGKISPAPFLTKELTKLGEQLTADLEDINSTMGAYTFDQGFLDRWIEWYTAQEDNPPFKDERFSGYMTRRQNHVLKLSLILNASRGGDLKLTQYDINRAIDTLNEVEKKMPYTFAGIGKNPLADVMARILVTIRQEKSVTFSDLLNMYYFDASKEDLANVIAVLEARKVCRLMVGSGNDSRIEYIEKGDRR